MEAMSWNVASVMTRDVVAVAPDAPYKEVVERLHERGVSAVPVVDADRRVLGIVSEADLLLKEERVLQWPGERLLDPHGDAARAAARSAAGLMTSPAVTVESRASLTQAARLMHRHHVKRLPVVDSTGRLVGIVSRGDLLLAFLRSDESIAGEVREHVLTDTLSIDPDDLGVRVEDGVVRLEGRLETRSLARILVRLVAAVEGVVGVVGVDHRLSWRLDDVGLRPEAPPLTEQLSAAERRDW
jgi:CBS-domain-containing membrane protein